MSWGRVHGSQPENTSSRFALMRRWRGQIVLEAALVMVLATIAIAGSLVMMTTAIAAWSKQQARWDALPLP